jgi:DNA-binding YbaB/EbfC family protein
VTINPFDIIKNAQKLQDQMAVLQNKLGGILTTGSSGGGMVEIDLNGRLEVLAVRIAAEAMEDREMLQDLVMAAFRSALEKAREQSGREISALASGMGMPPVPGPGGP